MKNCALWVTASVLALGWSGTAIADGSATAGRQRSSTATTQRPAAKPGETKAEAKEQRRQSCRHCRASQNVAQKTPNLGDSPDR